MAQLKDLFNLDKEALKGKVIGILLAVLGKLGVIGARELGLAVQEFVVQRTTPDGWTKEERGHYLVGRLTAVQREQIGPYWVDRLFDYVIGLVIEEVSRGIDDAVTGGNGQDLPTVQPLGNYYRVLSHDEFETVKGLLEPGDEVFRRGGWQFIPDGPRVYEWFVEPKGVGLVPLPKDFELAFTVGA